MSIINGKNLGFGLMRLPKIDGDFDKEQIKKMVDEFIDNGFTYFDTAYMYEGSEAVTKEVLISRYDRSKFTLATKMLVKKGEKKSEEDLENYFNEQLERTGAGYFDYYLIHSIKDIEHYYCYKDNGCFEFLAKKKKEGYIKHIGFSYHGNPEDFKKILKLEKEYFEFVQIQVNYADWNSDVIYSRELYEILLDTMLPIIVMEPIKGGFLSTLSEEMEQVLNQNCHTASPSSLALRYAASLPNVEMVLSGMSSINHITDNINTFREFMPLNDEEKAMVKNLQDILSNSEQVACTDCKYCVNDCPVGIPIPRIFSLFNSIKRTGDDFLMRVLYNEVKEENRAHNCISCGKCEKICPQQLKIIELLKESDEILKTK